MTTTDSKDLLRKFVSDRSEEAFRKLVLEFSPLVYGTALRKLGGNRAAAQDVMQEVFTLLAQKAVRLNSVVLGGWLYRQACRRAVNHVRSESRRKQRESVAMEMFDHSAVPVDVPDEILAQDLDTELMALSSKDRDALILRFFERQEFKRIGASLGLTEEAARKRVSRALDRLSGRFKRRGILAAGALLGETMSGYGRTLVPPQIVSFVSEKALQGATTSGAASLASLFFPLAAGVILTSTAALTLRQSSEDPSLSLSDMSLVNTTATRSDKRTSPPAEQSLAQIVMELKRVRSKPNHTLTTLQTSVLLKKIGVTNASEFVRLANSHLNPKAAAEIYQQYFERWMASDPRSALDFILLEHSGLEQHDRLRTSLINRLFYPWIQRDPTASEHWLLDRWDSPLLRESVEGGYPPGSYLAAHLVQRRFSEGGAKAAFELLDRLPTLQDRIIALRDITGAEGHINSPTADMNHWQELDDALRTFPDAAAANHMSWQMWRALGSIYPAEVAKHQRDTGAEERFRIALGLCAVTSEPGERRPALSGGYLQRGKMVIDRDSRIEAAYQAGLAAGLDEVHIDEALGKVLIEILPETEFFHWLDTRTEKIQLDQAIAAMAIKRANAGGWSPGDEMAPMRWARRIGNPALRLKISRGAFRLASVKFPAEARSYLETGELPADLKTELSSILSSIP